MKTIDLLCIGCGAVQKALLEIMHLEKVRIGKITIIEPKDVDEWLIKMYPQIHHVKIALTRENMLKTLKPFVDVEKKPFVVDLSTNTDTIKIIKICCKDYKCHLINTSIENYEVKDPHILPTDMKTLIKHSLMAQRKKLGSVYGKSRTTVLNSAGENPGEIQYKALRAIQDYTEKYGDDKQKEILKGGKLGKLAKDLGLHSIHISEIDTTIPKKKRPEDCFWNLWSCQGLLSEGRDSLQISDKVFPIRGMDVVENTYAVGSGGEVIPIQAFCIPHAEGYSLSEFLKSGDYRPMCYYTYHPSQVAQESLSMLRKNGYRDIPDEKMKVLCQDEIKSGYDSVGALLNFKNGRKWWCGSIMDLAEAKRLGFKYATPTTIQVCNNVLNSIKYIVSHPSSGLLDPEDIPYNEMLKMNKKYIGEFISKEITPDSL